MSTKPTTASLARSAGVEENLMLNPTTESAWIEVIQKMELVYADLVNSQVQIEEKNAALEEVQQFIRSVLTSMTDVLVVCDLQGRIQQVNKALELMTGRTESELKGMPLSSLSSEESLDAINQFHHRLEQDGLVDCEIDFVDRTGSKIPLALSCSHRYDHDGGMVGMVLIGRPLGELQRAYKDLNRAHEDLKQAQMSLVQSEKMASLGRLVAGVAHELNNPISFVFGNMHALQSYGDRLARYLQAVDRESDSGKLTELKDELKIGRIMEDIGSLIEGTLEGAERVRDIVQDLRRYSTSQQEPASEFDLPDIARTAVQWVVKACRVKPDIHYEMPSALGVCARKGHVHQILINLVQNAADVTEEQENPEIGITCRGDGGLVMVTVRDNGPGIPAEDLSKVFDPFFTTKAVGKGTGLGLSISYGLALDLGGNLKARNHAEGGAEFTLTLPVAGNDHG